MNKIQKKSIKLALENGYLPARFRERCYLHTKRMQFHFSTSSSISTSEILLDPLFWQALGKGLGWKEDAKATESYRGKEVLGPGHFGGGEIYLLGEWAKQMHRFINHLIEGKEAEEFFKEIIN